MRRGILQTAKFLAFLAIGLLLLWLAFRNIDFSKLTNNLKKADYSWLILSLIFGLFAFASRARRWILLVHPLGYKPSFKSTFNAMMTGYLANIALPRVGEITRCIALGKKEKIPVDQLIGTVVIERTIDFLSLLLIAIVLVFFSGNQIWLFIKESIAVPIKNKISGIFGNFWSFWIILFIIGTVVLFLLVKYRKNLRKIRFFSKLFDVAHGIINGLRSITNLQRKWEFILHTIFIWLNYALMTWIVVFSLESTSNLNFHDGIFLLVIGGLAMSAPVQSGLGVFHYIISRGLLIIYNIPIEDGLAYAILTHESQIIFTAIVGTISFISIFRKDKSSIAEQTS